MSDAGSWPPRSAHEAMLSSPKGRQRLADLKFEMAASPTRYGQGTPSFLDRLRTARAAGARNDAGIEYTQGLDEGDGDEEMLQLELAAIEARIKLKRLQKDRKEGSKPSSSRSLLSSSDLPVGSNNNVHVEVPLSPAKRLQIPAESRSPNRVLLGIDKGRKAADVSLRSARTISGSPIKNRRPPQQHLNRSSSIRSRATPMQAGTGEALSAIKSFSERMAQRRETDKQEASKRAATKSSRGKDLNIDLEEIKRYQKAAENSQADTGKRPPHHVGNLSLAAEETFFTREEIVSGKRLNKSPTRGSAEHQGDAQFYEGFSDLHLSSRILPHSFLKRSFPEDRFTIYTVPDLLKNVTSPSYELPDEVSDFVVFGIIASMSKPLDQKSKAEARTTSSDRSKMKWDDGSMNEKKFMAITMTDLKWTVDLFLFDTAVPRYHRLTVGTVIAIVNPNIMRPKKGREDTGAFSLSLHNSDEIVMEIGQARDLGFCTALKKDQKACGSWLDGSKTSICEYHLNMEIGKTQASRMGVNAGSNGFGGGRGEKRQWSKGGGFGKGAEGLLPAQQNRGYDWESRSHYYITATTTPSSSAARRNDPAKPPQYRAGMSTARMLDLDVDDPFIAEGQLARNTEARLQKHASNQEKERQIARELGKSRSRTNAGAEYMRKKHTSTSTTMTTDPSSSVPQQSSTKIDLRAHIGRKRSAQDVQLSPVKRKKTRFLTSTGSIKETGRESLGPVTNALAGRKGRINDNRNDNNDNHDGDDDDDDDLDII